MAIVPQGFLEATRRFGLPKDAVKIRDKHSDAVAYVFTNARGKLCAKVYFGKQSKPVAHYSYRNEAERTRSVAGLFASRASHAARVSESRKPAACQLVVGDILMSMWGYDQTNVDYYQVIALNGCMATIRKIARVTESTGMDRGTCAPVFGEFVGEPMRRRVSGSSVRIEDHIGASKWNTAIVAGVPVGRPDHWTAYA